MKLIIVAKCWGFFFSEITVFSHFLLCFLCLLNCMSSLEPCIKILSAVIVKKEIKHTSGQLHCPIKFALYPSGSRKKA